MKKRSYLFLAALTLGLVFQQPEAKALPFSDRAPASDAGIEEIPVDAEDGPGDKVCFCHNINHNPHTICTANQALIQAHMDHVNGEVLGVEDSLGECPEEEIPSDDETPTDETEEPCDEPEEPADEGEEPTEETETPDEETEEPTDESEEPSDEGETPDEEGEGPADDAETSEEVPTEQEEVPAEEAEQVDLPEATKVDGFEGDAEIVADADDAQGPAAFPAWYFEGSGNMGCSLSGAATGTTDLAPWALFAAVMFLSPLRKFRK